jgi:hypothetical protein
MHGSSTLNGNLPEVLVERQHDARFGLRQIQQDDVSCSGEVRADPNYVVAPGSKHLYNRLRKVLAGEKAHLRWKGVSLVFVGEIAGIGQTGEDIFSRQTRVVSKDFVLRLAGCQEFENELDSETRPADHGLASQDLRVNDDAL